MFQVNQVLSNGSNQFRIVWSSAEITYLIDIEAKKGLPVPIDSSEVQDMLIDGTFKKVEDPFLKSNLRDILPNSPYWVKREKAWNIIKGIVNNPRVLEAKQRGIEIRSLTETYRVRRQTIYRYLRRYWQRGLCKNSLIPDYSNSGNRGRKDNPTGKKLGRPRKLKKGTGINVTEEIRKVFRRVIEQRLLNENNTSINDAYVISLNILRTMLPDNSPHEMPTLDQFKYFYRTEYNQVDVIESQTSAIEFEKDIRPLKSTSTTESVGPGFRCQIDATIADIYLLSDHDRSRIVGRPVIYMVVDVFSRMILGMYIGFEGPSWISGMMAVTNVVESKVDYCKKYGVEINSDDWPIQGLPNIILADKGEFLGSKVEVFVEAFGVRIENAPARRGDAKGIVERYFDTLQCTFKPYTPGIVLPIRSQKRGGKDYRKDATLTVSEFTKIIILCVLYHNNSHNISKYDRCAGMPTSIPNVPIKLWNWGVSNLTGKLRAAELDLVKINLMPHGMATISDNGIKFFGCYFICAQAMKLGWYHRKKSKRPSKISVAYDLRSADKIYVRPSDDLTQYWICELSDRSRRFRGMTFWEVMQITADEKKSNYESKSESLYLKGELLAEIESIVAQSEKINQNYNASSLKGNVIHKNKQDEKANERKLSAFRVGDEVSGEPLKENVVSLNENDSFKYPNLDEILFEGLDE